MVGEAEAVTPTTRSREALFRIMDSIKSNAAMEYEGVEVMVKQEQQRRKRRTLMHDIHMRTIQDRIDVRLLY